MYICWDVRSGVETLLLVYQCTAPTHLHVAGGLVCCCRNGSSGRPNKTSCLSRNVRRKAAGQTDVAEGMQRPQHQPPAVCFDSVYLLCSSTIALPSRSGNLLASKEVGIVFRGTATVRVFLYMWNLTANVRNPIFITWLSSPRRPSVVLYIESPHPIRVSKPRYLMRSLTHTFERLDRSTHLINLCRFGNLCAFLFFAWEQKNIPFQCRPQG